MIRAEGYTAGGCVGGWVLVNTWRHRPLCTVIVSHCLRVSVCFIFFLFLLVLRDMVGFLDKGQVFLRD